MVFTFYRQFSIIALSCVFQEFFLSPICIALQDLCLIYTTYKVVKSVSISRNFFASTCKYCQIQNFFYQQLLKEKINSESNHTIEIFDDDHSSRVGFGVAFSFILCNSLPKGRGFDASSNLNSFRRASRAAISSAIMAVSPGARKENS